MEISPSFFGDNWSFGSGNFRLINRYAIAYKLNEKCIFVGGVAVYPRFQDSVWPIIGLIYKPNDKLAFNLIPDRPNISYAFTDRVTLFLEGGLHSWEFYVTRDNSKAILLYNQARIGCGVKFKINKFIDTTLSLGDAFDRLLKYRDSVGKVKLNDSLYTEFRIEARI